MRWIAVTAAATALVVVSAWAWLYTRGSDDQFASCRATAVAGGAGAIGGPFTLVNSAGQTVTDSDVITKPSLVYFGYTFCPDVCPLDNARNAEAVDILEEQGYDVTPVFISIDPERDTPEVVGEYAGVFSDKMIGLTGSPEQVKAASQAYRTYYKKNDTGNDYYLVDHSTFTYFVLPETGFAEFFRREATPDDMAQTVGCFIDHM
ncbi:SCO family protein [Salipiger sp. 1_MG-2023]|uniref:SCO family protein n=1 Tax=Salipiger sp. 1_MG-2023 TaxID=3062665 RepID=UPI0026E48F0F|nr:SCO family protein [Salipiger sp. 1_MG-2023]MDO6584292.1 SCO family protein [Salipiger sp. 1_MG-2023]